MAVQARRGSLEEAWVDIGVDDLTKYRIVEFVFRCDGDGADVRSLTDALGFHSSEQTAAILEELYRAGLLWLEWDAGQPFRCGLTADPAGRATLSELFALCQASKATPVLLARLARRSLDRVRGPHRRRGDPREYEDVDSPDFD